MKDAAFELRLDADGYALRLDGSVVAALPGGAAALLAGAPARVTAAHVEAAIERAEDWLMPGSRSWQGLPLRVRDATGRLRERLGAATLAPQQVEEAFTRPWDEVAFERPIAAALVADLVLLRELVHHGAVPRVSLG